MAGSLKNARSWCICFLHVQAPARKIHSRKTRSTLWKGRGAFKFSTCLLSQELLPACEIIPSRVFVSPRLARVIPVAFLRHSQRQFSASLLTSYLPSLFRLFSRPRSIEDYVEQQPKSPMPRCQKPFRWSPGGEKPGPK
jgi:hypothetical protein